MDPNCDLLKQRIHTEHKWPPRHHNRRLQGKGNLEGWEEPQNTGEDKALNEVGTKEKGGDRRKLSHTGRREASDREGARARDGVMVSDKVETRD